jgi:hypothetical protein
MSQRLNIALKYAARGWSVLPLNGKLPATAHAYKDASKDADQIHLWWSSTNHNIGIATGQCSGFFVLDVDGEDGEETLSELEKKYGSLPETIEVLTGNGRHLYFKTNGAAIDDGAGRLGRCLDVKCDGGYVVAPGSYHEKTGRTYEFEVDHHPDLIEIADPPQWLTDSLTKHNRQKNTNRRTLDLFEYECEPTKYALAALDAECKRVTTATIGTQERTLNGAAFNLGQLAYELPPKLARDRLIDAGLQMASDPSKRPWTEVVIREKVEHGLRDGASHLREERAAEKPAARESEQTEDEGFDMASLKDYEPGPVEWIIEPLIPIGFSLLAGRPKLGKSYFILDAAVNTANGDQVAAAFPTERTGVLFIAFEDDKDRIRRRLDDIGMEPENFPANCRVHINWPSGTAGVGKLGEFLTKYPDKRIVFIDTLQHILDPKLEEGYRLTTAELRPLRDLSRKHRVAIVGVLHTRKGKAIKDEDYDPLDFDNIIGSRAYSAVADAIIMMYRVQGEKHGRLAVTGRDMADTIFNATFENRRWTFKTVNRKQTIRKLVLEMFEQHTEAIYSPLDLCHRLGLNPAEHHDAMRQRLRRMVKEGVIEQASYGMYRRQKSEE